MRPMSITPNTKDLLARVIIAALFGLALCALVWRSFYTFCWIDESFYLSLADRLYRGGAPFIDEWHPAQFYAPLLLPFYALYRTATGGVEGIILYFRLLYVGLSFIVAIFSYWCLKRSFGRFLACCIALTYLFYIRGSILGMSYYSLSTTFFFVGLMLGLLSYRRIINEVDIGEPSVPRVLLPMAAGIAFALAVICNPYIIVFWFIACLTGLIRAVMLRRAKSFIPFAWAMAGAVVVACIYLIYILQFAAPAEIIENLPNMLSSHDENLRLSERLPNYLSYLPVSRIGFVGTWALVIVLIIWRTAGKGVSQRFRVIVLAIDFVCLVAACYATFTTTIYPNKLFIAFAEFALPCFLLQEDVRFSLETHPELHLFWIPGILLSLIWQFSSNTQVSGMLIGFMITCCGAYVTAYNAVPKQRDMLPNSISRPAPAWLRNACLVLIAAVVACTALVRMVDVYSDCPWNEMTATVESGPAAHLHTSEQHVKDYQGVQELVAKINNDESVWITPMSPWAYLEAPGACGVVSTWNTFMDQHDANVYFEQPGHEHPTWILVTNDDLGDPVNVILGRTVDFPALDFYHDYNAQLRTHLEKDSEYAPFCETDYGTLYKKTEFTYITQGQ